MSTDAVAAVGVIRGYQVQTCVSPCAGCPVSCSYRLLQCGSFYCFRDMLSQRLGNFPLYWFCHNMCIQVLTFAGFLASSSFRDCVFMYMQCVVLSRIAQVPFAGDVEIACFILQH